MATAVAANAGSVPQKTSHPFTCVTCAIAFRSSDLQRAHMRSDWHRYNLKRRVASLPPLSSEVFAEKVLSAQASSKAAAEKASFEKICQACDKTYFSEGAFKNHLGSQRHRMKLAALQTGATPDDASSVISSTFSLGDPIAPEDVEHPAVAADFQEVIKGMKTTNISDDEAPATKRPSRPHLSNAPSSRSEGTNTPSVADTADTATSSAMPINRCMFCNYDSTDLDTNLSHMTRQHGLFIPEQQYLDDLEGLVSYLQSKVTDNCECLFCHKLKNTVPGIQTHMRDKGHCMIAFTTEEEMLEVGQYYDFRGTYSDSEEEESEDDSEEESEDEETDVKKPRGVKLGAARQVRDEEDEEWESDEDDSSDVGEAPAASKRTQRNPANSAFVADGELYLPSGRLAGHREFRRYFRQNLRNYPTADERAEQQQKLLDSRAHGEDETEGEADGKRRQLISRAIGGLGMVGVSDAEKRGIRAREKKDERKAQSKAVRHELRLQQKANNQTHFRDDNFGIRR